MKNYQFTSKCRKISGFGGAYEKCCQTMVIAGIEWMDAHKDANPTFDQFHNITGLTTNENADMKAMQSAMIQAVEEYGATGAMMQFCTNHVLFANKNGWKKYIEEMEKPEKNS